MKKYAVCISIDSIGSTLVEAESEKEAEEKALEAIQKWSPCVERGTKGLCFNGSSTHYRVIEVDDRKVAVKRLEEVFKYEK